MKLIRSWPRNPPTGRGCVVDSMPRFIMDEYDYSPLVDLDDDVLLIEWDIAVDRDGLERFVAAAQQDLSRVIVAPYRLYETTVHSHRLSKPVWAHRRTDRQHVDTGEPFCSLFGFGLIYLPQDLVRRFLDSRPGVDSVLGSRFSDGSFSAWHRDNVRPDVPIVWDVPAVHLHYKIDVMGFEPEQHTPPTRQGDNLVLTMSLVDEAEIKRVDDSMIAALLVERNGLVRRGRPDRVGAVDEQLRLRGYVLKVDANE